jgi:hypothetical protein
MANVDNPFGFRHLYKQGGGSPWVQHLNKLVGYGTALFVGDVVYQVNSGRDIQHVGTPGTTLPSGVNLMYGAASTATVHTVIVDPLSVFIAQCDGSLVEADMGLNANVILGTGNAATLQSGDEIDNSTEAVTGTLDVHLLQKHPVPNNEYGANVILQVTFNIHRMHPLSVGV